MPVRAKAVATALKAIGIRAWYNNLEWTTTVTGVGEMPREEFDQRFWNPVDQAYEAVVDSIDWNRVFLEASARHISLEHEEQDYGFICEECLNEALLAGETFINWKRTPRIPRLGEEE